MSKSRKAGRAAYYHIEVEGVLSPRWSDYLSGVDITIQQREDHPYTILEGELIDQAALMGILNTLYNLGFIVLKVNCQTTASES